MSSPPAYDKITEHPGSPMSATQIAMANTRYKFAAGHSAARDVIEVGCGSGFGLAYLRGVAARVAGGDIDAANTLAAKRQGLPVVRMDAHHLPFADASADVVLLFESIYYLRDAETVIRRIHRVLRPGGQLLICLPNRQRPGFHPSPHSTIYPSATQLHEMLGRNGFEAQILAGFPIGGGGAAERIYLRAATIAVRLRIIPRTLKGRARIKRLLLGRLPTFTGVDGVTGVAALDPVDATGPVRGYANLYVVARKRDR